MKTAATLINGVCVASGSNIQEQKCVVKGMLEKYGAGNVPVEVLFSAARPAMRKRIALPEKYDVKEIMSEGAKGAKVIAKRRADMLKAIEAEKAAIEKVVKASRDKRRASANGVKNPKE